MEATKILAALLEFADAASAVYPFDVVPFHSTGFVFLWDSRDDADAAIQAAIATDAGGEVVCEAIRTTNDGRSILGLLAKPKDNELDDYAGTLRTAYVYATGPDPETLEPPF